MKQQQPGKAGITDSAVSAATTERAGRVQVKVRCLYLASIFAKGVAVVDTDEVAHVRKSSPEQQVGI